MSYNIDSIDIIAQSGFRLPIEHIARLRNEVDFLPESNFLEDCGRNFEDRDTYRYFDESILSWHGEGSGRTFDALIEKVLPCFHGSADLVVCWEGGDSYSGVRVVDGRVTKHRVVMTLGEEVK